MSGQPNVNFCWNRRGMQSIMDILISGCSFSGSNWGLLTPNNTVRNLSAPGAGNSYISDSIIQNLHTKFDLVVVMFTGVYRVDLKIPKLIGDAWLGDYKFRTNLNQTCYVHGGGILGSWKYMSSKLSLYFESQYKAMDFEYLENQGVEPVLRCLQALEQSKQRYLWGWIYDIHQDYRSEPFGHSLGRVQQNWPKLQKFKQNQIYQTPYEYCKNNNLLDSDSFHPTIQGYQQFSQEFVLTKL